MGFYQFLACVFAFLHVFSLLFSISNWQFVFLFWRRELSCTAAVRLPAVELPARVRTLTKKIPLVFSVFLSLRGFSRSIA
uniref:Uncharacterized protein n=1 Tax=Arundo donax TaxID=35708 RepID=A0A0A9HI37_ARUDO